MHEQRRADHLALDCPQARAMCAVAGFALCAMAAWLTSDANVASCVAACVCIGLASAACLADLAVWRRVEWQADAGWSLHSRSGSQAAQLLPSSRVVGSSVLLVFQLAQARRRVWIWLAPGARRQRELRRLRARLNLDAQSLCAQGS